MYAPPSAIALVETGRRLDFGRGLPVWAAMAAGASAARAQAKTIAGRMELGSESYRRVGIVSYGEVG